MLHWFSNSNIFSKNADNLLKIDRHLEQNAQVVITIMIMKKLLLGRVRVVFRLQIKEFTINPETQIYPFWKLKLHFYHREKTIWS